MMKGMLKPVFTNASIFTAIDDFERNKHEQILHSLAYVGEGFVNDSRMVQSYKDQTGNLRSSIGYAIGLNGKIKKIDLEGKSEGKKRAKEVAEEICRENNEGYVLIGFAGMEYAAAVEAKGYDVITGSVPAAETMLRILKQELGVS
jgi:hypothetical protein